MRKPAFWFSTWSDTNQAVQQRKMAGGLINSDLGSRGVVLSMLHAKRSFVFPYWLFQMRYLIRKPSFCIFKQQKPKSVFASEQSDPRF